MNGIDAAVDAYTMPIQRLSRRGNLAPLRVPQQKGRDVDEQSEASTERFVTQVLGKRRKAVPKKQYEEKPGGASDASMSLMEERRQRIIQRQKQQQLEEVLFAINAQSIEHEARAREKRLPISSVHHGVLASNEAQKWIAIRTEQTDQLLLDAKRLVRESRDSRGAIGSLPSSAILFPSRGNVSANSQLLALGGSRGEDGVQSSADSVAEYPPRNTGDIPVTEWFSEGAQNRRMSRELQHENVPRWDGSTVCLQPKATLPVPGSARDVPATDVEEVLRTIYSEGVAAARPRTFVSQVVCAVHTYGTPQDRSQRLKAVGPLLGRVKIPPIRKSFVEILQEKRQRECQSIETSDNDRIPSVPAVESHEVASARAKDLPPRAASSADATQARPVPEDRVSSTQHSKRSSSGSTRRSNGSVQTKALPVPSRTSRAGRAPLAKTSANSPLGRVGKAARRTTSDLFEALAASTEGGRTRYSDELSCIHSDLGTLGGRSAVHTPDMREEAELAEYYAPVPHHTYGDSSGAREESKKCVPPADGTHDPSSPPEIYVASSTTDYSKDHSEGDHEAKDSSGERNELLDSGTAQIPAEDTFHPPCAEQKDEPAPEEKAQKRLNEQVGPASSEHTGEPGLTLSSRCQEDPTEDHAIPSTDAKDIQGAHTRQDDILKSSAPLPVASTYAPNERVDDAREPRELDIVGATTVCDDDGYGSSDFEPSSPQREHEQPDAEMPTGAVEVLRESVEETKEAVKEPVEADDEYEDEFDAESPKSEAEAQRVAKLRAELRVAGDEKADDDEAMYTDDEFEDASPQGGDAKKSGETDDAEGDAYATALSAALRKLKGGAADVASIVPPPDSRVADVPADFSKPPSPSAMFAAPSTEARPDSQRRGGRTSRHGTGGGTKTAIQYTARDFFGDGSQAEVEAGSQPNEFGSELADPSALRPTSRASVSTADHRTGPISPVSESVPDSSRGGRKERVVSLEIGNFEEIDIGGFPSKKQKKQKRKSSTSVESESSGSRRGNRKHGASQGLDL